MRGSFASLRMIRSGFMSPRRNSCGALRSNPRTTIGPRGARTLAPRPLSASTGSSRLEVKSVVGATATARRTLVSIPSRLS